MNQNNAVEVATLAGGCFWCLEAIFREVNGVVEAVSGYTGGTSANPSYNQVCAGTTGHAESVQVTFNPRVASFEEIIRIFFSSHDPTTLNRQGADIGTQYRSAIFYHSEEQKNIAEMIIHQLNAGDYKLSPIVTEVAPAHQFYAAKDYHQNYFEKNSDQTYCQMVIAPKLTEFRNSNSKE